MRFSTVLPLSAAASALVLPSDPDPFQAPLGGFTATTANDDAGDRSLSWWDQLPFGEADLFSSAFDDSLEYVRSGVDTAISTIGDIKDKFEAHLKAILEGADDSSRDSDGAIVDAASLGGHHNFSHHTIYHLIKHSNYTTKFAELVDEYPDLVKLLNSTETKHTLFVPVDEAFKNLPHGKDKPSKKDIEQILRYHIGVGDYPVRRILNTQTLPTELDEDFLGGEPQRLRLSVGLLQGIRVNGFVKVIAPDIEAKNGHIHAVRYIVPPVTMVGRLLNFFPAKFSTLLLAYERTDFVKDVHGLHMTGSTVFAPTNKAFENLGLVANAYLFNSEHGLKCLKALLKYQIVPNATLYTDAFYDNTHHSHDADSQGWKTQHYSLKTLLNGEEISVDTAKWGALVSMRVNAFTNVAFQNAIAKNGVVQVLDKVVIPPHKHKSGLMSEDGGDITVEELIERLGPYVDEE